MNEGKWVSQLRDLASRPGVGVSNTPYQVLPTYVEPGVWEGSYGQFYPNTTTANLIPLKRGTWQSWNLV